MFTGIITAIGEVTSRDDGRVVIDSPYITETISLGASIACDGCCLTVTDVQASDRGSEFGVDVSNETFSCTTLGDWRKGRKVNLERALQVGEELGGHIVTGHVDGVADIVGVEPDGESKRFTFDIPSELSRFIAPKGSVALAGTSLTVNEVDGTRFGVNLIPHTFDVTCWGHLGVGDKVNMEVDLLARYVARLNECTA